MPKSIDRDLLDCLRRPNPNVEYRVEISAPDVGLILRRPDQFIGGTSKMVPGSMSPAGSLMSSIYGSLGLVATGANLAAFTGTASFYDLNREDPGRRLKGMRWTLAPGFNRARLRTFTARVRQISIGVTSPPALDFELQIYRVTRTPGRYTAPVKQGSGTVARSSLGALTFSVDIFSEDNPINIGDSVDVDIDGVTYGYTILDVVSSSTATIGAGEAGGTWTARTFRREVDRFDYAFNSLITTTVMAANIVWAGGDATITFPLQNYGVAIENGLPDTISPDRTSELPAYYFVVRPVNPPVLNSLFSWKVDTVSSRAIDGVGSFERVFWNRETVNDQWIQTSFADVPSCTVEIDTYPASGQAVYEIDLGRMPSAGTIGRVVSEGHLPRGTVVTVEISYTGSGGPWYPIKNADEIPTVQQIYHLRVTLYSA